MKEWVVIIGASGHGKVVADIIQKSGVTVVGGLDDNSDLGEKFVNFPVLGKTEKFTDYRDCKFVIAGMWLLILARSWSMIIR